MKGILSTGIAVSALIQSAPIMAQTTNDAVGSGHDVSSPEDTMESGSVTDQVTSQAGDDVGSSAFFENDEIVVTAQRRSERLVDVPVTVTVATAEKLETTGVTSVENLPQLVPGLKIDYAAAFIQPTLRGIGTANAGPGVSSSIATYIDGFYVPAPNPSGFNFANVENVQVLAGPQGTLFGRNSTAGAILITTRQPTDTPTISADVGYGSFNTVRGNLFVSAPLSDNTALSLFGSAGRSDGFVRNVLVGGDAGRSHDYSVRGKLRLDASDSVRFTLGAEYSYLNDPNAMLFTPYKGRSLGVLFFNAPAVTERGKIASYGYAENTNEGYAFNLTGEFDLGFGTLKSLTQYRNDELFNLYNYDGSAAALVYTQYDYREHTVSQEINLSSKPQSNPSWVAGLFLYSNKGITDPLLIGSSGPDPSFSFFFATTQKTTTIAPYIDATYQVDDHLFLTAGLRYSRDTAEGAYTDFARVVTRKPSVSFKDWTPRFNIRYEFSPSANIYASFSKGTKPGLYNANAAQEGAVQPEKLTAYEIGSKFARNGFAVEASAFYYDYKGLQVGAYDAGIGYLANAGKVEIYGGQLHVAAPVTEEFTLDGGIAYTHGTYKEFDGVQIYEWDPQNGGIVSSAGDVSGRPIQRSPEVTANLTATYKSEIGGGDLLATANIYYQSKAFFDTNGAAVQRPYALLGGSIAYTPKDSRFTFSITGTNLTDKIYRTQVLESSVAFGQIYGRPRSVFGKVAYNF